MDMHTSSSKSPKRMRLGTRSCAECRRRRVRCQYPPRSQECKECAAHGVLCEPQQPSRLQSDRSDTAAKENVLLHQRIDDLEGLIRNMCKSVDLNMKPPGLAVPEMEASEAALYKRLEPSSVSETSHSPIISKDHEGPSRQGILDSPSAEMDSFEAAPLLRLFQEAMIFQRNNSQVNDALQRVSLSPSIEDKIKNLKAWMPRLDILTSILETTEKYWYFLPLSPNGPVTGPDQLRPWGVAAGRDFILDSLESRSPAVVAKSLLWLALCIHQLPVGFNYRCNSGLASRETLLEFYVTNAETLISADADLGGTIEGIGSLVLQAEMYINTGKPRKAWLSIRRALNSSLLLGLHYPDGYKQGHHNGLWLHLWQIDRHLSLVLGLPYGIAELYYMLPEEHVGPSAAERATYDLGIIAGQIIERNKNHQNVDYSVTLQIEQELERCRKRTPADWWDDTPSQGTPPEALFTRYIIRLFFYQLGKYLHLPYMLKSYEDAKFEHSRISALEASRDMIKCYQTLRNSSGAALLMCDLMDFQVFSAGVAIVINLLSKLSPPDTHQEDKDWELVHTLARNFKNIYEAIDCSVAGQAAQLLEYLCMARNGSYSGPESFEAVIPYFGKIHISSLKRPPLQIERSPGNIQTNAQQSTPSVMEISANTFKPFGQNFATDYLTEAELGIDWTAGFELDLPDIDYDWCQVFDSTSFGQF